MLLFFNLDFENISIFSIWPRKATEVCRKVDIYGSYTESCNPYVTLLQSSNSFCLRCLCVFLVVNCLWNVLYKTWTLLTDKEIYIVGLLIDMLMASLIYAQTVNTSLNWIGMQVKASCNNVLAVLYKAYAVTFRCIKQGCFLSPTPRQPDLIGMRCDLIFVFFNIPEVNLIWSQGWKPLC